MESSASNVWECPFTQTISKFYIFNQSDEWKIISCFSLHFLNIPASLKSSCVYYLFIFPPLDCLSVPFAYILKIFLVILLLIFRISLCILNTNTLLCMLQIFFYIDSYHLIVSFVLDKFYRLIHKRLINLQSYLRKPSLYQGQKHFCIFFSKIYSLHTCIYLSFYSIYKINSIHMNLRI